MSAEREQYLGDGVYAAIGDDHSITLDLRGQDDTTRIVLEPEVLHALARFAAAHGLPLSWDSPRPRTAEEE